LVVANELHTRKNKVTFVFPNEGKGNGVFEKEEVVLMKEEEEEGIEIEEKIVLGLVKRHDEWIKMDSKVQNNIMSDGKYD
jgi:DNA-binding sugar fermentation-stimulating protein